MGNCNVLKCFVILVTIEESNIEKRYVIHYRNEEVRYLHIADYPATFIIISHSNTYNIKIIILIILRLTMNGVL